MEDHEFVGVVRDRDLAGARIEDAGVAAGRATDGFLDREVGLERRPRQPDAPPQDGQALADEGADLLRPRWVVRPRTHRHMDGRVQHGRRDGGGRVGPGPIGDQVREELEWLGQDAAVEDDAAIRVGRGRRDRPRLDLDLVAGREHDRDRAAWCRVTREGPHRERHERVADPQVACRCATRVCQVERQLVDGGLAAGEVLREIEAQQRVALGPLRDPHRRRAGTGPRQGVAARRRQHGQERVVEEEPLGDGVAEVVRQREVDRHAHAMA